MLAAVCASPAFAHPFGDKVAAQRIDVVIRSDRVDLTYIADVPTVLLETARPDRGERPEDAMIRELATGLNLSVAGKTLPLTRTGAEVAVDLIGGRAQVFTLTLQAPVDLSTPIELVVANGNLPDIPSWFANTALVAPGTRVTDSSLIERPRRSEPVDHSGRWDRGESNRRLTFTLVSPDDPLSQLHAAVVGWRRPTLTLLEASPRPFSHAWTHRAPHPHDVPWVAAGALALGATTRREAKRTHQAAIAGGVLFGVLLASLHPAAALFGALPVAVVTKRPIDALAAAGAALWLTTLPPWPVQAAMVAAWGLAWAAPLGDANRGLRALLAVALGLGAAARFMA